MTARAPVTIVDALRDPRLFGSIDRFKDLSTWGRWITFLKAVYGLELTESELTDFRRFTGRSNPRPGGYQECCVVVGVQSGKSQVCALIAAFEAARAVITKQKNLYVPLIAQDHAAASRALFNYVTEAIESSPALAREVQRKTARAIELPRGVTIETFPCRPAAVRGLRAAAVVVDELAFFIATDGHPTDTEMLRACRGRVATTGGKVIILSSPYGMSGALYELHQKHFAVEDSDTLVWQADAQAMNPTLSDDYIERMLEEDPDAAVAEVMGEFRDGLSSYIDHDVLRDSIEVGVRERLPEKGIRYVAHFDAASGTGRDTAALAIAHMVGDVAVQDLLRAWTPPFSLADVITEASETLRRYKLSSVQVDRWSVHFTIGSFKDAGIAAKMNELTTSDTYAEFLPAINSGAVRLLDIPELAREFRSLERRTGRGKDRIDHRRGAHDDRAAATAGALYAATKAGKSSKLAWLTGRADPEQRERLAEHKAVMANRRGLASAVYRGDIQVGPSADWSQLTRRS